jgi:hypothetical protein
MNSFIENKAFKVLLLSGYLNKFMHHRTSNAPLNVSHAINFAEAETFMGISFCQNILFLIIFLDNNLLEQGAE